MDDLLHQAAKHLRAMWKHRWLGLIGAVLVGLIGTIAVLKVPDKYEASARVYVDTQSILQPLMAGLTVQPNVEQQVEMLSRTLINRPNVEKLIHMADLDLKVRSPAQKEELIDQVTKTLAIKSTDRDNLYTLTYRDSVPAVAKRVVQSLTTIFVESNLGDKRTDSSNATQFIDQQIADYEKKLVETETKLKEFKIRNINVQVGEGKAAADHIGELDQQLAQARMELNEAINSRDSLRKQLSEERQTIAQSSNDDDASLAVPDIDGRIQALKSNLDSLLQRYTEQHPDVVQTRKMIRELEQQRQTVIAARKRAAAANPNTGTEINPVYQQLKISLGTAEANVASLQARVAGIGGQYSKAIGSLKEAPGLEAEYAQLTRDYNIIKNNYDQLVSRRESAEMSGKIEAVGGMADFRVIDPPQVSSKPVEPNRVLLLGGAYLVSIAAGLFFSFAGSQLRPVFFDARTLREVTELPVLGVISLIESDNRVQQVKKDKKRFFMALAGVIGLFLLALIAVNFLSGRGI
ncbi:MAG: GNVR domain-containing protein [Parasulfuritortus sp.]|jgi:polysaccharide chain length determinant protein (PEP-CTERM system associated)|nr:GNVR domain-containing protein [Parasulfuritortus sp.]